MGRIYFERYSMDDDKAYDVIEARHSYFETKYILKANVVFNITYIINCNNNFVSIILEHKLEHFKLEQNDEFYSSQNCLIFLE